MITLQVRYIYHSVGVITLELDFHKNTLLGSHLVLALLF